MTTDLAWTDPQAVALVRSIHEGDLVALRRLLDSGPHLSRSRIRDRRGAERTPLHVAADWPGYFPDAPSAVRLLAEAGADPSAPLRGGTHRETPLHWAASSDDLEVAAALVGCGADIEAGGGSIGGTPLTNAVAYGCWHVARFLVAEGASVPHLWEAAALGLWDRIEDLLDRVPGPSATDIDEAFWQACHGRQRRVAEFLLGKGAKLNDHPGYSAMAPVEIAAAHDTRTSSLLEWLSACGALSSRTEPSAGGASA